MRKIILLIFIMSCGSVSAATFQGSSAGAFINPIGSSRMKTTGVGTDSFTWGRRLGSSSVTSLGYEGKVFDANKNEAFVLGTLSYANGTILKGTSVDKVDLGIRLQFSSPLSDTKSFNFNLGLINTPNTSDARASADIVNFNNTMPSQSYTYNSNIFTLEFLGFGNLTGDGFTVGDSFRVLEGSSASVDLLGRIATTSVEAPVPAAGWLFGSALFGLLRSRKKSITSM